MLFQQLLASQQLLSSTTSSRNLRQVASANILTIEQRRQELESRGLEAEVKMKEE